MKTFIAFILKNGMLKIFTHLSKIKSFTGVAAMKLFLKVPPVFSQFICGGSSWVTRKYYLQSVAYKYIDKIKTLL